MKVIITILVTLTLSANLFAQDELEKASDSIVNEGRILYRSEMASWYGTDLFLEKFKELRESIGGYFSYSDNGLNICIFFSKGDQAKVIGTITFDSTFRVDRAQVDGQNRDFTNHETDIYLMRKKALVEISSDTLFKSYQNTNLNIIPLIGNNDKKVYVLTGPQVSGVVVFGNDYLLTFDRDNNLISKRQLHKNIIPVNYGNEGDKEVVSTMHSHLPETGDLITATDICTLMLYERIAKWPQHIVVSDKYVSIWDCGKDELLALTRQAWENIYKDQKSRKKRSK